MAKKAEQQQDIQLVGESSYMRELKEDIHKIAQRDTSVLIIGPSGTGKDLIAKAIHDSSKRSKETYQPINCSAFPEGRLEAELFGHKRGAFTGAIEKRVGILKAADKGTVFLDEIGDMPSHMQVALLRTLDSGEIRPVGDDHVENVDVRILAATNKNLGQQIEAGEFREDLYNRIAQDRIITHPLSKHPVDVVSLTSHFSQKWKIKLDPRVKFLIYSHALPGNVRELKAIIKKGDDFKSVFNDMAREWESRQSCKLKDNRKDIDWMEDKVYNALNYIKFYPDCKKMVSVYEVSIVKLYSKLGVKDGAKTVKRNANWFYPNGFRRNFGFDMPSLEDEQFVNSCLSGDKKQPLYLYPFFAKWYNSMTDGASGPKEGLGWFYNKNDPMPGGPYREPHSEYHWRI